MDAWVVLLVTGDRPDDTYVYGPFDTQAEATGFAREMSAEVDPARPCRLSSPLPELLNLLHHLRESSI